MLQRGGGMMIEGLIVGIVEEEEGAITVEEEVMIMIEITTGTEIMIVVVGKFRLFFIDCILT
jgi:hypothetical protein